MSGSQESRPFVAYASKDAAIVQALVETVTSGFGKPVSWDKDIRAGDHWEPRVRDAIDRCERLVLFWSERAADSKHVEKEWQHAERLGKRIVPILLDDTPLPDALSGIHHIDWRHHAMKAHGATDGNQPNASEIAAAQRQFAAQIGVGSPANGPDDEANHYDFEGEDGEDEIEDEEGDEGDEVQERVHEEDDDGSRWWWPKAIGQTLVVMLAVGALCRQAIALLVLEPAWYWQLLSVSAGVTTGSTVFWLRSTMQTGLDSFDFGGLLTDLLEWQVTVLGPALLFAVPAYGIAWLAVHGLVPQGDWYWDVIPPGAGLAALGIVWLIRLG